MNSYLIHSIFSHLAPGVETVQAKISLPPLLARGKEQRGKKALAQLMPAQFSEPAEREAVGERAVEQQDDPCQPPQKPPTPSKAEQSKGAFERSARLRSLRQLSFVRFFFARKES